METQKSTFNHLYISPELIGDLKGNLSYDALKALYDMEAARSSFPYTRFIVDLKEIEEGVNSICALFESRNWIVKRIKKLDEKDSVKDMLEFELRELHDDVLRDIFGHKI